MKLVSTTAFHVYLKAVFDVTSLSCNVHANRKIQSGECNIFTDRYIY